MVIFADRSQAQRADATAPLSTDTVARGNGLDFGTFCDNSSGPAVGLTANGLTDSDGVAIPGTGGTDGQTTLAACADLGTPFGSNVIREAKDPNDGAAANVDPGQIDIDVNAWPFVQLYNLNPTGNVVVQYNKGGGVQTTTLTFDTAQDFASAELDRSVYGQDMEIHATITDLWLNIDPTDEDSWTFATNEDSDAAGSYYQVFNENGDSAGDAVTGGVIQLDSQDIEELMCDDNCILFLEPISASGVRILEIQDNDDSNIVDTVGDGLAEDFATAVQGELLGQFQ